MVASGPPAAVLDDARLAGTFRVGARRLTDPVDAATLLRFHCLKE